MGWSAPRSSELFPPSSSSFSYLYCFSIVSLSIGGGEGGGRRPHHASLLQKRFLEEIPSRSLQIRSQTEGRGEVAEGTVSPPHAERWSYAGWFGEVLEWRKDDALLSGLSGRGWVYNRTHPHRSANGLHLPVSAHPLGRLRSGGSGHRDIFTASRFIRRGVPTYLPHLQALQIYTYR